MTPWGGVGAKAHEIFSTSNGYRTAPYRASFNRLLGFEWIKLPAGTGHCSRTTFRLLRAQPVYGCLSPMRGLVFHGLAIAPVLAIEGSALSRAAIIRHGAERMTHMIEQGTTTEEPEVREIDAFGRCTIPMWNVRDFVCEEHLQVEAINMFEDIKGRLRKKMDDGQSCTIQCPDARWWQVPWHAEMTCTRGIFKYGGDRAIVKKIECATSAMFKSAVLLIIALFVLGILVAMHFLRRKSPSASVPSGGASQPVQIVRRNSAGDAQPVVDQAGSPAPS
eukprot:s1482_g8.t1